MGRITFKNKQKPINPGLFGKSPFTLFRRSLRISVDFNVNMYIGNRVVQITFVWFVYVSRADLRIYRLSVFIGGQAIKASLYSHWTFTTRSRVQAMVRLVTSPTGCRYYNHLDYLKTLVFHVLHRYRILSPRCMCTFSAFGLVIWKASGGKKRKKPRG